MINIIGGIKKKTKLLVPLNKVRPTSSQKREAIFSILESYGVKNKIDIYFKKNFIDLFAGSGALGLEAISRGANYCYFNDNDKNIILNLEKNCTKIANTGNFKIITQNAFDYDFIQIEHKISTIFIDPPYKYKSFSCILTNIYKAQILQDEAVIVIETSKTNELYIPKKFIEYDIKIYGKTKIIFLIYKN